MKIWDNWSGVMCKGLRLALVSDTSSKKHTFCIPRDLPFWRRGHLLRREILFRKTDSLCIEFLRNSHALDWQLKECYLTSIGPGKDRLREELLPLAHQHNSIAEAVDLIQILHRIFHFPWHLSFLFINPQACHLLYLPLYRKVCTFSFTVVNANQSSLQLACSQRLI